MLTECGSLQMISKCFYRIRLIRLIVVTVSKVTIKLRLSVLHVSCLGLSRAELPVSGIRGVC